MASSPPNQPLIRKSLNQFGNNMCCSNQRTIFDIPTCETGSYYSMLSLDIRGSKIQILLQNYIV